MSKAHKPSQSMSTRKKPSTVYKVISAVKEGKLWTVLHQAGSSVLSSSYSDSEYQTLVTKYDLLNAGANHKLVCQLAEAAYECGYLEGSEVREKYENSVALVFPI